MIVGRAGRCPRCDTVHGAGARFCGSCGLDFTSPDAAALDERRRSAGPALLRARPRRSAAAIAKVAGLVWLVVGGITVLGAIGELTSGGQIGTWAGISAVLELLTGAALFLSPTWEMLTASMLWGILSVLGVVYAALFGSPPSAIGLVLALGICVATALSWLGRRPMPVPAGMFGSDTRPARGADGVEAPSPTVPGNPTRDD